MGFQPLPQSPALFLSSLAKQPSESQDSTGAGSVPSSVMTRDLGAMLLALLSFPALCSCLLCMDRQAGKDRQIAKTREQTRTDTYTDTQTPSKADTE